MATFLARLGDIAVIKSIFGSFGLKGLSIALNFGLITLLANRLDQHAFGTYSLIFSAVGMLAIVAIFGQQMFLLRKWSEYSGADQRDKLIGALKFSSVAIGIGTLVTGLAFFLVARQMLGEAEAAAGTAYLVALALTTVSAHVCRSAYGLVIGDALTDLGLGLPPIAALLVSIALGTEISVVTVFSLMAAGGFVVFFVHLLLVQRAIAARYDDAATAAPRSELRPYIRSSLRLWGGQTLEVSNQYLDVLIVGAIFDPASAGIYFIITRLANMFSALSAAIYVSTTRHLPELYFARKQQALEKLLDVTALVSSAATTAALAIVLVAGAFLLRFFGVDQPGAHLDLLVLSCGTALLAVTGPAPVLLNMAGHEGRYFALLAVGVAFRLSALLLLAPHLGIFGAVLASALSMLWVALRSRSEALKLTGLDVSILRLLPSARSRTRAAEASGNG